MKQFMQTFNEVFDENGNVKPCGREKCKEWHHSEEAKKWHSEHQKEYIKKILISVECDECGKTFNTFNDKRRKNKCHKCRDRELHRLIRQKKKNSV